jgi:hypothetical protein
MGLWGQGNQLAGGSALPGILLILAGALWLAGCGTSSVSAEEAAGVFRQQQPRASNVSCEHIEGDDFSCKATIDGKPARVSLTVTNSQIP